MEDDEEEDENKEFKKNIDLLIKLRSLNIDKLNRIYQNAVQEHKKSIKAWEASCDDFVQSKEGGKTRKNDMQDGMMKRTTSVLEIHSWLNKEKLVDKDIDQKRTSMQVAKSNEKKREGDAQLSKDDYLLAEKKLEKIKLLKEMINDV